MRVSEKKRGEDGDKEVKGKRKTRNNKRENEGDDGCCEEQNHGVKLKEEQKR